MVGRWCGADGRVDGGAAGTVVQRGWVRVDGGAPWEVRAGGGRVWVVRVGSDEGVDGGVGGGEGT